MDKESLIAMIEHLKSEACDAVLQFTIRGSIGHFHVNNLEISEDEAHVIVNPVSARLPIGDVDDVQVYTLLAY